MKKFFNAGKKPYEEDNIDWAEDGYNEDGLELEYEEEAEIYEEDDEYYMEEGDSGEYYEDEEYDTGEPYYAEESYYEEGYEDEEEEVYGQTYGQPGRKRIEKNPRDDRPSGLWNAFVHMHTLDRIVLATGVIVLVLALITGGVYFSANMLNEQVSSFGNVGSQLADITVIGEEGLTAVADAELARINAANSIDDEEIDYEEEEYTREVSVGINLTSIEKDLKVKFVNKKTNKLIGNVPFSVKVTTGGGNTEVWTDDDMDGIIYKQGIASGSYTVALQPLEGEKYQDYILTTNDVRVDVKDKLEYKKVDVKDEIKTEDEINASKEDTAKKNTEVESSLKDTVAWVDSTQGVAYKEIKKSEIKAPDVVASVPSKFTRLSGETVTIGGGTTVNVGATLALSTQKSEGEWQLTGGTWASNAAAVATVSDSGVVTGVTPGTAEITYTWTGTKEETVSEGDGPVPKEIGGKATYSITVNPLAEGVTGITITPSALNLDLNKKETMTGVLTAVVEVTGNASKELTWKSSDEKVATVKKDDTGKVVVTAVGKGTATITATSQPDGAGLTKSATCTVTVSGVMPTILTLEKDKLVVPFEGKVKLVAKTTPEGALLQWTSDKPEIATVAEDGTITGVKEGTATITVATVNGLTQKCTITVAKLMTLDKTTVTVPLGGEATVTVKPVDDGKGKVAAFTADDKKISLTVKDMVVTLKGLSVGATAITVKYTSAAGQDFFQDCTVTVMDATGQLKANDGNPLYVKLSDGTYKEAVTADYYKNDVFYVKTVKYTGWQTISGKLYFYDSNGKYVTGEQVIQGAKYNFASDGSLVTGNGSFGIDVSKWNGTIDWKAVKNSGVSYVIIRCGYRGSSAGSLIEDPKFKSNIKGATAAGLKVGVYFFSQAINKVEAVEEASMVLELIKGYTISYPVFLDVESSGGRGDKVDKATRTEVVKTFCETIQNSGYTAGVYANKSWLETKMDAAQLTKYKIWLAQYASTPTYTLTKYDLWQYKSTGRVSGISGNVDLNISYLGY